VKHPSAGQALAPDSTVGSPYTPTIQSPYSPNRPEGEELIQTLTHQTTGKVQQTLQSLEGSTSTGPVLTGFEPGIVQQPPQNNEPEDAKMEELETSMNIEDAHPFVQNNQ